jgi:hypothetical protein
MQRLNFNKFSREDIKTLLPTQIQKYLYEKYNIEDEQLIES